MKKFIDFLKIGLVWTLRVVSVLLGFLLFWPLGSSLAGISWTKIVSMGGSELSSATIRTITLGDTIRYVYMAGTTPYTGPSDLWLYIILAVGFLVFCWWFLGLGY